MATQDSKSLTDFLQGSVASTSVADLFASSTKPVAAPAQAESVATSDEAESDATSDEAESDTTADEAESVLPATVAPAKPKPPKNFQDQKPRTVSVGNIAVEVLSDKAAQRELLRLFRPAGSVECHYFRRANVPKNLRHPYEKLPKDMTNQTVCTCYIVYTSVDAVPGALRLNSTLFRDRHLRVIRLDGGLTYDRSRSVFVGNLPFNADEEKLRSHFAECGDIANVRILRDSISQQGKGTGYLEFTEKVSVGLALSLHESRFMERELRVERCKDTDRIRNAKLQSSQSASAKRTLRKLTDAVKNEGTRAAKRRLDHYLKSTSKPALGNFEGERANRAAALPRSLQSRSKRPRK
ncbi:Nucleolar protein 12 [Tieghemiomyces parasiticus]|uniref:Nucleolar protein 12 n=1 Tax=Tieghemiomyces parasiticus TaxID=78921 RepID=A0A9W7ZQX9_9FUNG|nr:Nucleolar protein 12 [Tieghemiomyces parasiticus]